MMTLRLWVMGLLLGITGCATRQPAAPATVAMAAPASVSAPPVKRLLRRNIDDLSAQELAAYEHAVAMMRHKSQANPFDRQGFTWQA
ncbi:hypothetical protein [Chitinimonas lacunae]|uniref:Uncharacterized protein n=1 Tax=Chitinimonas lacunae TaxID=1963018 RepID=A0ABV8MKM4_9NEIS